MKFPLAWERRRPAGPLTPVLEKKRGKLPAGRRRSQARAILTLLALLLPLPAAAYHPYDRKVSQQERETVARLAEKYQTWLQEVDVLLTEEERATFLALEKDYQRDSFIEKFWQVRDPVQRTAANGFKERWEANVRQARELFGDITDGRSRVMLLNGVPDERIESNCSLILWPLEVWFYPPNDKIWEPFAVVLYRKWGAGPFRVWNPGEGTDVLFAFSVLEKAATVGSGLGPGVARKGQEPGRGDPSGGGGGGHSLGEIMSFDGGCGDYDHARKILAGISWVGGQGMHWDLLEPKLVGRQPGPGHEWVSTFNSYSTDVPADAPPLPAKVEVSFPGRWQGRTMMQGMVTVPASAAGQAALGEARSYNLQLIGEVLHDGRLFDSFRYKFDLPVSEATPSLPLAFERPLRPGDYTLIVKVEDVNSGKLFRDERALAVPATETPAPAVAAAAATPEAVEVSRILAEADAALRSGETTIKLTPPLGQLQTGMQRFDTLTTGRNIARVTFLLDGKPVLTKQAPPYSVELDLGKVPRTHLLAVTAFDAAGAVLSTDELQLNSAGNRFRVRLAEPQKGKRYESSLLARAEVETPEGEGVERVELYLNESKIATLYQPPYVHPVLLPRGEPIAYVRAVAYLADGNSTENVVFVNAPENLEEMNVDLVELYTTVLDKDGHPVTSGLAARDFGVTEDGARQQIVRCDRVTDMPIHAAVAIDVSASMESSLPKAQEAALRFLEGTVKPRDRAAIITFNDHPNLAVKFTRDLRDLAGGLAGLKAERGTALYDSLVYSFYTFNGLKGRRALLLLSDGRDEGSHFTWEEALEFARRAGVTVYAIGLGDEVEKKKLSRLSEETGGRAFFPKAAGELPAIYAAIEEELRSQYLIAYQSATARKDPGFRSVDLKVSRPGLEAKTIRGYYP
ncbi:MAG TPA: VWA domain-containing protein [Thermoanaerobaculia bacterium]|nr:VWA domain-containing protein [Thermoanaerobaculia bacterium]